MRGREGEGQVARGALIWPHPSEHNHPVHGLPVQGCFPRAAVVLRFQSPDRWAERPFSNTGESHGAVTTERRLLALAAPPLLAWQEDGTDCCDYSDFDLL